MKHQRFCINDDERTAWFPEYRYFVPVLQELDQRTVVPDRTIRYPAFSTVPRVDGEVEIASDLASFKDTGVSIVTVSLVPNAYTAAQKRLVLGEFFFQGEVHQAILDFVTVRAVADYHRATAPRSRHPNS